MALKEGWRGRFWEDFEVGDVYEHPLGRTINAADNSYACTQQQDNDFVAVTGEFGQASALPPGFTIQLVSGGGLYHGLLWFVAEKGKRPA